MSVLGKHITLLVFVLLWPVLASGDLLPGDAFGGVTQLGEPIVEEVDSASRLSGPDFCERGALRTASVDVSMFVDGLGTVTQDFYFVEPIPLDGASWITWEAITARVIPTSGVGSKRTTVAVSLIVDSGPVAVGLGSVFFSSAFPTSALTCSQSARLAPLCGNAVAVRLAVTNSLDSGATGSLDSEITTIHKDSALRIHFAYGYAPLSNQERTVFGATSMALGAPGATNWQTHIFNERVLGDNLRFVRHTGFGTGGTSITGQISSIVESQLILDNDEFLSLDDAYSPSLGVPPPASEARRSSCNVLLLDVTQQMSLSGVSIRGWRWRGVQLGTGTSSFTPPSQTLFVFFKNPPECDSDGICEPGETCHTCPGDCPRPRGDVDRDCDFDLKDVALMQNEFNGPASCPQP